MKMIVGVFGLILVGVCEPCSGQSYVQSIDWALEDFEEGAGDVYKTFRFATVAGVGYSLQSSHDGVEWNTERSYYGMGQEVLVSLWSEQDLRNPPEPEGIPTSFDDMPTRVTLILREVDGEPGLVVSWKSMEDGSALQTYLPAVSLTPEAPWDATLIHTEVVGDTDYTIINYTVGSPEDEFPGNLATSLSAADAEMISGFQTDLAALSATVAAGHAAAVNAPARPPLPASSLTFFRLASDWTVNSDGDDRYDWEEHADGSDSDAFNPDSDGDGVADGYNDDRDGDGIVNGEDAVADDELIAWERVSVPHYVHIPVDPALDTGYPVMVTDDGEVLFQNGVWSIDSWTEFETETNVFDVAINGETGSADLALDHPVGITNSGEVVGFGTGYDYTYGGDFQGPMLWMSVDMTPTPILNGRTPWMGVGTWGDPKSVSRDGYCLMTGTEPWTGGDKIVGVYRVDGTSVVEVALPDLGDFTVADGIVGRAGVAALNVSYSDGSVAWHVWRSGESTGMTGPQSRPVGVTTFSNDRTAVTTWLSKAWLESKDGGWEESTCLPSCRKLNRQGVGITLSGRVWVNGEYHEIEDLSPGLADENYDEVHLLDINDHGVILVQGTKGGVVAKGVQVPIKFVVPWSGQEDAEFEDAVELKVAKFKGGELVAGALEYTKDVDRFRVQLAPMKISDPRCVLVTEHPQDLAAYNDSNTILKFYRLEDGAYWETRDQFLVSDTVDDTHTQQHIVDVTPGIPADQQLNDCSHLVALGGKVVVLHLKWNDNPQKVGLEVPVKASHEVTVKMINPKKTTGSLVAPAATVLAHKKVIQERYAQVGLRVKFVDANPVAESGTKFTNIELHDGNEEIMLADEIALLEQFTNSSQADIEIVYIENFKEGTGPSGGAANTSAMAYSSDRVPDGMLGRYSNTILLAEDATKYVAAHELGHVLIRSKSHAAYGADGTSNLMNGDVANVQENVGDSKRLNQEQATRIHQHPVVKKLKR